MDKFTIIGQRASNVKIKVHFSWLPA